MLIRLDEDDDIDVLPVELDRETVAWLAKLEQATGSPAARIVASMLHDIRVDDEKAHRVN